MKKPESMNDELIVNKLSQNLQERMTRYSNYKKILPVTIEFNETPLVPKGLDLEKLKSHLESETKRIQQPVINKLLEFGIAAENIESLWLGNSLNVSLKTSDLYQIAQMHEIRIIQFNGPLNLTDKTVQ